MLKKIRNSILNLINKGDARSVLLKKNVALSVVVKGLGLGISYIRFPLILSYLGNMWHGVWLTIGSFTGWLSFFNIGLGNGLRNKLAESLAREDLLSSKKYVSSTYFIISIISVSLFLLLLPVILLVDWNHVFNMPEADPDTLRMSLLAFVGFFCLRFILTLIRTVLQADQRPAFSDMMDFLFSSFFLLGVLALIKYTSSSLLYVISISGGVPVVILTLFSLYYYQGRYKELKPSFKYIDIKMLKGLTSLGAKFFIVQIAVIVLFATDNMIITRLFGPEDVVPYSAARKYFGIVEMGFSIILGPFWSAFTDAFVRGEITWVRKSIRKLMKILTAVFLTLLSMLIASPFVYQLWLGDKVDVPFSLSVLMMVYVMVRSWNNIFVYFINGVGKIKMQLYMSVFTSIINIPLSVFLARNMEMGINGVILATIICLLFGTILHPIQYFKIVNGKAKGIWDA
ncbi:lipopolysaccharide biosynthesis protein [Carboxylicivirga sp. RSCT41]|uniref:lipopolysaccharide biosynthesis protein n=1 Tax=Carboxylicivirga agarovorans TaxID=3417570 RepID=UPI003D35055E